MINKYLGILVFCILTFSFLHAQKQEGYKKVSKKQINKILDDGVYSTIDINNIEMWFSNTGSGSYNPQTYSAGCYFPKGTVKTCIFADGPILSGMVANNLRLVGSTYNSSFQAGSINNGNAENPSDPKFKIYKIRKDWKALPEGPEKLQYQKDYENWPINDGAPWEYDTSGKKIPKFIGDMQAWWVMNDKDSLKSNYFYNTQSIGTEWQCLIWAYNLPGVLGNTIFKKFTIINKGNNDAERCYLSFWSDPDVGNVSDDLCGCDTISGLGYAYNGNEVDAVYGKDVPAVGFDILQGPLVPSEYPLDKAHWDFSSRYGYKNLSMIAFNFMESTNDDCFGYNCIVPSELYNAQQGLKKNGTPWINPKSNKTSTYVYSGDPVSGKGWIDGFMDNPPHPPGDRRILLSCGPFNLMRKDTQEFVVGTIIGVGADRLTSISVLKFYDLYVKSIYNLDFRIPVAPPSPDVSVTELSKKIVLNWGNDEKTYGKTESFNTDNYKFEGYNVYQLPTPASTRGQAKLIATYDISNKITTVFEREADSISGLVLLKPVQLGKDAGIKRFFIVERDYLTGEPLVNGQNYYFAVTAYSCNPDPLALPRAVENGFNVFSTIPQDSKMGYRFSAKIGDILQVIKYGNSDVSVIPMVIDPAKTTGHNYEVSFNTNGQLINHELEIQTFWRITDKFSGKEIVKSFNLSGDDKYPVFDGLFVKVINSNKYNPNLNDVKFTFTAPAPYSYYPDQVKPDIEKITVFPNPYYGYQMMETDRLNRYVTFSHLPAKATIKIFTLSGTLVRTLQKNDDTQYIRWNLLNDNNLYVASGIYIIYIDMPEIGAKKILKLAIILENTIFDRI